MVSTFDVLIVGQGLAGTALAWNLRWSGLKVFVVDRESTSTSSKIAAGLITPITGQKLVRTWNLAKLWPAALNFYRRVEQQTGSSFFRCLSMVRLFQDQDEVALFEKRLAGGEFCDLIERRDVCVDPQSFDSGLGGFEMNSGGQLDVREYLRVSRETFKASDGYRAGNIDVSRDIELRDGEVLISKFGISAKWIVFCQGIEAMQNPWFRDVQFKPAKGEILGLRIPGLKEDRVIHRGIWLSPVGGDLFKAGSTYDWNNIDSQLTTQGQDEITSQLRQFLRIPFEVISHEAAVRPIHRNQYPVIGIHPHYSQQAYFNGLGSKGSLQSPYFASQLVQLMLHGNAVDPDVDLNRKTRWQTVDRSDSPDRPVDLNRAFHVKRQGNRPLTEQAQEAIRQVLGPGEHVIDATAGNGHDTQFLAELVGPSGTVFAFDVQPDALKKTAGRLVDRSLQNVILLNHSHDQMLAKIPSELHDGIGAVMFNLGYLPGGDKQFRTNAVSTRSAIKQATKLIRQGGVVTVVSYTGHDGGEAESVIVQEELNQLDPENFQIETIESSPGRFSGPRLFIVKRLEAKVV